MSELHPVDPEPLPIQENTNEPSKPVRPHVFFGIVQKLQRYSSYAFTGFLGVHAAGVLVAPALSPQIGNETILFARELYHAPGMEGFLVFGSLAVHIASGIILRLHQAYLTKKNYNRLRLPRLSPVAVSGYILAPLVTGHLILTRLAPLDLLGDSSLISLDYISYGFHKYPIVSWIGYIALGFLTLHHSIWGYKKWFSLYGRKYRTKTFGLYFGGILMTLVSLLRISRLPPVTGWIEQQYSMVYSSLLKA